MIKIWLLPGRGADTSVSRVPEDGNSMPRAKVNKVLAYRKCQQCRKDRQKVRQQLFLTAKTRPNCVLVLARGEAMARETM